MLRKPQTFAGRRDQHAPWCRRLTVGVTHSSFDSPITFLSFSNSLLLFPDVSPNCVDIVSGAKLSPAGKACAEVVSNVRVTHLQSRCDSSIENLLQPFSTDEKTITINSTPSSGIQLFNPKTYCGPASSPIPNGFGNWNCARLVATPTCAQIATESKITTQVNVVQTLSITQFSCTNSYGITPASSTTLVVGSSSTVTVGSSFATSTVRAGSKATVSLGIKFDLPNGEGAKAGIGQWKDNGYKVEIGCTEEVAYDVSCEQQPAGTSVTTTVTTCEFLFVLRGAEMLVASAAWSGSDCADQPTMIVVASFASKTKSRNKLPSASSCGCNKPQKRMCACFKLGQVHLCRWHRRRSLCSLLAQLPRSFSASGFCGWERVSERLKVGRFPRSSFCCQLWGYHSAAWQSRSWSKPMSLDRTSVMR